MIKRIVGILLVPLQLILMLSFGSIILSFTDSPPLITFNYFFTFGLIFFIAVFLFRGELKSDWEKLSIPKWKFLLYTVLGVFMVQFVYIFFDTLFTPSFFSNGNPANTFEFSDLTLSNKVFVVIFSTSALFTAVTEEIYFRYLFLNPKSTLNRFVALITSSMLFGLSHYFIHFNLASCIPYFGIGLFLGIVYLKSKNIWIVIAIHLLNNFLFGVLIFLFQ